METKVFVTRLTQLSRDELRIQAVKNGRTMAREARVIIEDALGVDRCADVKRRTAKQKMER
jgi:plasmid stability protein